MLNISLWNKLLYALSLSIILCGLIALFGVHTPKPLSLGLIGIPLIIVYALYIKNRKSRFYKAKVNQKNISLGVVLIFVDIIYSLCAKSPLGPFDYFMLTSGLFIISLNLGLSQIVKLDPIFVNFSTYFLFLTLVLYSIPTGLAFLFGISEYFLFEHIAQISIVISTFFLNFIKPTTNIGNIIEFNGFTVAVGTPCSGVQSMAIFLSAAIAYFISTKEKNLRKIGIYTTIGASAMFLLNIPRIMIIVLVGYNYGNEMLLLFHNNLGWIMFALAMATFWFLVFRNH